MLSWILMLKSVPLSLMCDLLLHKLMLMGILFCNKFTVLLLKKITSSSKEGF